VKWIAIALLLGVFVRHDTALFLAGFLGFPDRAWFYMLGGAGEVLLCTALLPFARGFIEPWRFLALSGLWIWIIESAQLPICRAAITDMGQVPHGVNLCDFVTDLPIGATMTALYLIVICLGIFAEKRDANSAT
jgi:hypothetical protein